MSDLPLTKCCIQKISNFDLTINNYSWEYDGMTATTVLQSAANSLADKVEKLTADCAGTFSASATSGTITGVVEFSGDHLKTEVRYPGSSVDLRPLIQRISDGFTNPSSHSDFNDMKNFIDSVLEMNLVFSPADDPYAAGWKSVTFAQTSDQSVRFAYVADPASNPYGEESTVITFSKINTAASHWLYYNLKFSRSITSSQINLTTIDSQTLQYSSGTTAVTWASAGGSIALLDYAVDSATFDLTTLPLSTSSGNFYIDIDYDLETHNFCEDGTGTQGSFDITTCVKKSHWGFFDAYEGQILLQASDIGGERLISPYPEYSYSSPLVTYSDNSAIFASTEIVLKPSSYSSGNILGAIVRSNAGLTDYLFVAVRRTDSTAGMSLEVWKVVNDDLDDPASNLLDSVSFTLPDPANDLVILTIEDYADPVGDYSLRIKAESLETGKKISLEVATDDPASTNYWGYGYFASASSTGAIEEIRHLYANCLSGNDLTMQGGAVLGGSADVQVLSFVVYNETMSGGLKAGGNALEEFLDAGNYSETMQGGAIIGGSASGSMTLKSIYFPSGKVSSDLFDFFVGIAVNIERPIDTNFQITDSEGKVIPFDLRSYDGKKLVIYFTTNLKKDEAIEFQLIEVF